MDFFFNEKNNFIFIFIFVKVLPRRQKMVEIEGKATLAKALQILSDHNISAAPVKQNGNYTGFISFLDIIAEIITIFNETGLCFVFVSFTEIFCFLFWLVFWNYFFEVFDFWLDLFCFGQICLKLNVLIGLIVEWL